MAEQRWRIPNGIWSWRASVLIVVVVAAPPIIAVLLSPHATSLEHQAAIVGLFVYPVALASALQLYFHWRLTSDNGAAWLAVVLTAGSVQALSMAALRTQQAGPVDSHLARLMTVDLLWAGAALAMVTVLARRTPRFDPGALGIGIGLFITALRFAIVADPHTFDPGPALVVVGDLLVLALHLALAAAVLRLRPLPGWARLRFATALVLLSINRAIAYPSFNESWQIGTAIVTDLAGAILLCSTSLALLRNTTRRRTQEIDALYQRIDEVEHEVQGDRERLHEITATIAGIASATRLMHDEDRLPSHRRAQLEGMVGSEIARLERLMDHRVESARAVDLDDTLRPLVIAQHTLGRSVHWSPTGLFARGRPDHISEVLNILLDNAGRHAPGAPVWVTGRELADTVEIRVRDAGPGIPREMAERVFENGHHGPQSSGQGIGLHMASRLMQEMGGSLRLIPVTTGTVFVVCLPIARQRHDAATASAQ